jgi:hypothetical protein
MWNACLRTKGKNCQVADHAVVVLLFHWLIDVDHRVHTEWQWPLSGIHFIMMVKSAQPGKGGGCALPIWLSIPSRAKLWYTLQMRGQIHSPYFSSIPICTLWPRTPLQGLHLETWFHIGMDRNFVCLWCKHNCRSQVIDISLSALISWFMKSIIGFFKQF